VYRIGGRVVRFSAGFTALAWVLCAFFVYLGQWQWQRGQLRQQQWLTFESSSAQAATYLRSARDWQSVQRFQRVQVMGTYDPAHQFLLDNMTRDGRAGFEVLTSLQLTSGESVLVNRGWIPASGYRDRLPVVKFEAAGMQQVTGRIDQLPVSGLTRGRAAPQAAVPWPKLTSFPKPEELRAALDRPLRPQVLLLDKDAPYGYRRDWRPPGISPLRHWSYAVQWWCFAAGVLILWIVSSLQREVDKP
jgi:surfeit locus 1 family protein